MFPEFNHDLYEKLGPELRREYLSDWFLELMPELQRKYVRSLQPFWLGLHGVYGAKAGVYGRVDIETVRKLDQRIGEQLREMVDAWLASGRTEDGQEYPFKRQIPLDQLQRLHQFLREQQSYVIQQGGLSLEPEPECPELDDINHRRLEIREIALRRKREGARMRNVSALDIGIGASYPLWQTEQWEQYALDESMRLFLTLLHAYGLRFLLVQCPKCSRYDFTKTREQYKRGWHCVECRKAAATLASAQKTRNAMQQTWMKLAVKARRKYKRSYGEQPVWLAGQVNKRLKPEQWVKRNWITRHLDKIENSCLPIEKILEG